MVWYKDLPLGSKAGNLLDDDIRTNNAALETALSEEHAFATGGTQTGKHSFAVETEATRDADTDYTAGSVSITTDTVTGQYVFTFTHDGTTWHTPIEAFLNNANDWVKGQYVTPTALIPGASISSTLANANVFTVTLDQNSTLANPTDIASYSGKSGVWYYIITQDSTARTLAFGNKFVGYGGAQTSLTISDTVDSVNVYQCILDAAGNLQTTYLNRPFATDAETIAGTVTYKGVTPANILALLASSYDDTASAGYFEILGTGLLVQWITVTDADNNDQVDFATAFDDTAYAVIGCSNNTTVVNSSVNRVDEDTVQINVSENNHPFSIIAIGKKAS